MVVSSRRGLDRAPLAAGHLQRTYADPWGVPVHLGERRVLDVGRWRKPRTVAWLVLVFFLTALAFGLPLQAAADLLPPGNRAPGFAGVLVACAAALSCYLIAVRLGEGRCPVSWSVRCWGW
jgi:hypothetical protein